MSDPQAIVEKVASKFSDAVLSSSTGFGDAVVNVDAAKWKTVAKWLATDGGFSFLSSLTGLDRLGYEPRFAVVYELLNMQEPARLRVKVPVPEAETPKIASVVDIWPTADWHERETFDMFGIVFEGHPNLSRILMPDEWEGHPLRKDYAIGKVPVEYKHLSPGF